MLSSVKFCLERLNPATRIMKINYKTVSPGLSFWIILIFLDLFSMFCFCYATRPIFIECVLKFIASWWWLQSRVVCWGYAKWWWSYYIKNICFSSKRMITLNCQQFYPFYILFQLHKMATIVTFFSCTFRNMKTVQYLILSIIELQNLKMFGWKN